MTARAQDSGPSLEEAFWAPKERRRPGRFVSHSPLVNAVRAVLVACAVATAVGLALLWPHGRLAGASSFGPTGTDGAKVLRVARTTCPHAGGAACQRVTVKLTSGLEHGRTTSFAIVGQASIALAAGDHIRVYRNQLPPGATAAGRRTDRYGFADFDRTGPMLWLAAGFVALLLVTGRLHGLRALLGLAGSLLIVVEFVIPAILHGRSPVAVALVGSLAVMLVTMPLSYGLGAKMLSAVAGTALSLLVALGLADGFAHLAHLSGASSDESTYLAASQGRLSLQGLLVAGMVIGALGVLVDLTVSQASTVISLRRANPALGARRLVREAMAVGHDHIAATVNTLVFAYAGAALPVLLIFTIGHTPFTDAVNGEAVAEQIVATLVGSIGLILSMPITTVLAALLAVRMDDRALGLEHAHAH